MWSRVRRVRRCRKLNNSVYAVCSGALVRATATAQRHIQIDMVHIIPYRPKIFKQKMLMSQRYVAGRRIDEDTGRRRQPTTAAVDAHAGAQIEPIAVPWATQHAILRGGLVERPEPVRADRRMSDELSILQREDAERLAVELHEEGQPQLGRRTEPQRGP